MPLKYTKDYLYIKNDNKFAYTSNVRVVLEELLDILDEHYYDVCSHILKLESVKLVCIVDKNYDVLYGLHKLDDNIIQKELLYIKKLEHVQYKILIDYYNMYLYERALKVVLESGYNLIIIIDSLKHLDIIKSLINSYL